MAASAGTVDVSMPKLMAGLTLRVRFAKVVGLRLRAAAVVMRLAGHVAGCGIEIETGAVRCCSGLPSRGSMNADDRAFDPMLNPTLVFLNGVEQHDVETYDLAAGLIVRAARGDDGKLRLTSDGRSVLTETLRGHVRVERSSPTKG